MGFLKRLFSPLPAILTNRMSANSTETALSLVGKALPIITIVSGLTVGLTPSQVDDVVWESIKKKYPTLFSGNQVSEEEIKLAALAAAAEILQSQNPGTSTTIARTAVQLAYIVTTSTKK